MTDYNMQIDKKKDLADILINTRMQALEDGMVVLLNSHTEDGIAICKSKEDRYYLSDFDWVKYSEGRFSFISDKLVSKNTVMKMFFDYCEENTYHKLLHDYHTSLIIEGIKEQKNFYKDKYERIIDAINEIDWE